MKDYLFTSKVVDLLHLLEFAEIKTPSYGDNILAQVIMRDLRNMPKGSEEIRSKS